MPSFISFFFFFLLFCQALAKIALEFKCGLHVDNCLGSLMLPFLPVIIECVLFLQNVFSYYRIRSLMLPFLPVWDILGHIRDILGHIRDMLGSY